MDHYVEAVIQLANTQMESNTLEVHQILIVTYAQRI